MTENLLTDHEVAEILRVKVSWVRQHAAGTRKPLLPSVKIGYYRRYERAAITKFIEDCRQYATGRVA